MGFWGSLRADFDKTHRSVKWQWNKQVKIKERVKKIEEGGKESKEMKKKVEDLKTKYL